MGYTTDFIGEFKLNKPLTVAHKNYLDAFNDTRRMQRNAEITEKHPDPIRKAVGLPVGREGEYFVGGEGFRGQKHDMNDIIDHNRPPADQPGLWCQWVPNANGDAIEWDGVEKFYDYVEWLEYIIGHFLAPWGYKLNGEVEWEGEESGDVGKIVVIDNDVSTMRGRVVYD